MQGVMGNGWRVSTCVARNMAENLMKFWLSFWFLLALCLPAMAAEPWDALHQGGVLIVMRHAATDAGIGDPPGFQLGDCTTQRNLSPEGRAQAQRFGALLAARGVRPVAVYSSAWCRCVDTAALAFPTQPARHLAALDSLFHDGRRSAEQTATLRAAAGRLADTGVTVWITHQVNATALTGEFLRMGEALVLRPDAAGGLRLVGRLGDPLQQ